MLLSQLNSFYISRVDLILCQSYQHLCIAVVPLSRLFFHCSQVFGTLFVQQSYHCESHTFICIASVLCFTNTVNHTLIWPALVWTCSNQTRLVLDPCRWHFLLDGSITVRLHWLNLLEGKGGRPREVHFLLSTMAVVSDRMWHHHQGLWGQDGDDVGETQHLLL